MHKTSTKRTKNAYDRQQKSDENIELHHTNYKLYSFSRHNQRWNTYLHRTKNKYHEHFEIVQVFLSYIHRSAKHTRSSNENDLNKVDCGLENVVSKYYPSILGQCLADQLLYSQNIFDRNISIV